MKSHEITQEELDEIDINDWIKNHEVHKDRLTPAIIITAVVICSGLLTLSFAGILRAFCYPIVGRRCCHARSSSVGRGSRQASARAII